MNEIIQVNIEDVKPYKNNPRNNDGAVEATANSIKEFGWQQPIVVDKDNVIIVGHTRLRAAKRLGLKQVPIVVADNLSDDQVKAYRLADNKTGELADWDLAKLDIEIPDIDLDLTLFGFDDELDIGTDDTHDQDKRTEPNEFKADLIVPPFSVINTASGDMLKHKKAWLELLQDDGSSRNLDTNPSDLFSEVNNGVSIMNPATCELICRWYLQQGKENKTFDCFSGDPSFGFVSSYLGNSFTGVDIRQQQVDFNNGRVKAFNLNAKYIQDDGQNIASHLEPKSQDLLFSCPPYFDLEVYSDDPNDASNQNSYEDFIKILENAFAGAITCLKDNRFATIVVSDIRDKQGFYYSFVDDVKRIFKKHGMGLLNEIILQDPIGTAPIRARKSMRGRKAVKIHQNLLVFYKGDPKQIKQHYKPLEGFDKLEDLYSESTDL